jgi:hypothetical protein
MTVNSLYSRAPMMTDVGNNNGTAARPWHGSFSERSAPIVSRLVVVQETPREDSRGDHLMPRSSTPRSRDLSEQSPVCCIRSLTSG